MLETWSTTCVGCSEVHAPFFQITKSDKVSAQKARSNEQGNQKHPNIRWEIERCMLHGITKKNASFFSLLWNACWKPTTTPKLFISLLYPFTRNFIFYMIVTHLSFFLALRQKAWLLLAEVSAEILCRHNPPPSFAGPQSGQMALHRGHDFFGRCDFNFKDSRDCPEAHANSPCSRFWNPNVGVIECKP